MAGERKSLATRAVCGEEGRCAGIFSCSNYTPCAVPLGAGRLKKNRPRGVDVCPLQTPSMRLNKPESWRAPRVNRCSTFSPYPLSRQHTKAGCGSQAARWESSVRACRGATPLPYMTSGESGWQAVNRGRAEVLCRGARGPQSEAVRHCTRARTSANMQLHIYTCIFPICLNPSLHCPHTHSH